MLGITIKELIDNHELKNMTPEIDTEGIILSHPDVNRPALQLAGFFAHFDSERVQIIGHVEQEYILQMDEKVRRERYDKLLSYKIPCIVYARGIKPDSDMLELCNHYEVPCLVTDRTTSDFLASIGGYLRRGCTYNGRERNRKKRGGT